MHGINSCSCHRFRLLLRASEANEVPISNHIALTRINSSKIYTKNWNKFSWSFKKNHFNQWSVPTRPSPAQPSLIVTLFLQLISQKLNKIDMRICKVYTILILVYLMFMLYQEEIKINCVKAYNLIHQKCHLFTLLSKILTDRIFRVLNKLYPGFQGNAISQL